MKKNIIALVFLATAIVAEAQVPVDPETKKIVYQEVVTQEGSKDTLYLRAAQWINSYFKNAAEVTKIKDRENGKLQGQHRIRMVDTDAEGNVLNSNTIVGFTFTIEAKEGRYRFIIDAFDMKSTSKYPLERWLDKADPTYIPKYDEYLKQVDLKIKEMITDMKKGMQPKKVKNDQW